MANIIVEKLCSKCELKFPLNNFHKDKTKIDGYYNSCKSCRKIILTNYYQENKISLRKQNNNYIKQNKEANKIRVRKYRIKNKIRLKEEHIKNISEISNKAHIYYENNKEYIKKRNQIYIKNKKKSDLGFMIKCNLRSRLNKVIRNKLKSGSAVQDLGCSIEELKIYMESKFQKGMNWDNYGFYGWHIDHIKPLSKFDLTDRKQFLEACNYINLQPLWWQDNLRKGNRLSNG